MVLRFVHLFVCFLSDLRQAMMFNARLLRIPAIKISVNTRCTTGVV